MNQPFLHMNAGMLNNHDQQQQQQNGITQTRSNEYKTVRLTYEYVFVYSCISSGIQ